MIEYIPYDIVFKMLLKAADEGMKVGKAGTEGEYTSAGIAYTAFQEFLKEIPQPHKVTLRNGDL